MQAHLQPPPAGFEITSAICDTINSYRVTWYRIEVAAAYTGSGRKSHEDLRRLDDDLRQSVDASRLPPFPELLPDLEKYGGDAESRYRRDFYGMSDYLQALARGEPDVTSVLDRHMTPRHVKDFPSHQSGASLAYTLDVEVDQSGVDRPSRWYFVNITRWSKWSCYKRFSDFQALDGILRTQGLTAMLPSLPQAGVIGLRHALGLASFEEKRKRGLQTYLDAFSAHIDFAVTLKFLWPRPIGEAVAAAMGEPPAYDPSPPLGHTSPHRNDHTPQHRFPASAFAPYGMSAPQGDRPLYYLHNCIGQRVQITHPTNESGVLRFFGETQFAHGVWAGVELDTPTGGNDGSAQGAHYFRCKPGHGLFVRPEFVVPINGVGRRRLEPTPRMLARIGILCHSCCGSAASSARPIKERRT